MREGNILKAENRKWKGRRVSEVVGRAKSVEG